MGFLDHSTNNIIVDAVLTDIGRQMLAANDGSFRISQFAFSDEEVDYGIIKKFGRNVGQEKIEKNTPILEALTRANLAQKFKLSSVSNTFLTQYPAITIEEGADASSGIITFSRDNISETKNIRFEVKIPNGSDSNGLAIDSDLIDNEFFVEVNNLFFTIQGEDADIINVDNTVVYRIGQSAGSTTTKVELQFTLKPKGHSITLFNTYAITATPNFVKTFIKVTGATSGLTKNIEVRLNQTSS